MNNSKKKLQCKPNSLDEIIDSAQAPGKITTLYMIAQFFSSASAPGLEQRASRDLGSISQIQATGMRGSRCEQCNFKTFCRVMNHCTKVQVKNEIPNDYTKEKNDKQTWKTLRSPSPYVCPWWPPPRPPWCRAPLLLSRPSSRCPPETLQCIYMHLMFPSFGGDEETLMYV